MEFIVFIILFTVGCGWLDSRIDAELRKGVR